MILDYTKEESLEWLRINDKYVRQFEKITVNGIAYLDRDAIKEMITKDNDLRARCREELDALHDDIENRRIAAIADNPAALLQELKKQQNLALVAAVQNYVHREVADREEKRLNAELRNALQEERNPDYSSTREDFNAVYDEVTANPLFTQEEAREIINKEAVKIIAALQPYKEADEIESTIAKYLQSSPFIIKPNGNLPAIHYNKSDTVTTVTDKLAHIFFSLDAPAPTGNFIPGQRSFAQLTETGRMISYEGKKSKNEITLFYDFSYNEEVVQAFGLDKRFTDYDYFVMTILDNLHEEGNDTVSLTKIWREMGNEGNPSPEQLTELANSMRKGLSTIINIDDTETLKEWKQSNGRSHQLVSPVMPVQFILERFIANGKVANGTVKITGFSPFYMVGRPLAHIGTWDKKVLRLYSGRKTKRYYGVLRYLLREIGWIRNPKSTRKNTKIVYSSLYSYLGDKTTRAQQLSRDMLYRLLDEVFIPLGYVMAYKEEGDASPGIKLTIGKEPRKITQK